MFALYLYVFSLASVFENCFSQSLLYLLHNSPVARFVGVETMDKGSYSEINLGHNWRNLFGTVYENSCGMVTYHITYKLGEQAMGMNY